MANVTYTGPDEVNAFVLIALKSGLKLWLKTGMQPNRGWTRNAMIAKAASLTGKAYANSRKGAEAALADLEETIADAMEAGFQRKARMEQGAIWIHGRPYADPDRSED